MSPSIRFKPGDVLINRYEILNFHAAGGMQEVYLTMDHALGRIVVLKTPKIDIQDRRFRRGAEMGARVNHPNVAATFDYYEDENITFMVEEYIEGQDLGKRLINDFIYLDPYLAAHVIHHIAKAIFEAHKVGICHRDLKPSNIIVSSDFSLTNIKLTDFGISKLAESELEVEMARFDNDNSTLTQSNTLLGAVPYMAPECWSNWKGAGQPMDIWALGCIGYHLLTGKVPFGSGRAAIVNLVRIEQSGKVELQQPVWFGKHPNTKKLEDDLWDLILSCIVVDPRARPTAESLVKICNNLVYPVHKRDVGVIQSFRIPYATGGNGAYGTIKESLTDTKLFFHGTEYYGDVNPAINQRVSFSIYPGTPWDRASPVLLLR